MSEDAHRTRRTFYVALGAPRDVDPETVYVAYRKVVSRYREALQRQHEPGPGGLPPESSDSFRVMRSYCDRRHAGRFEEPEPLVPERGQSDLDRFFDGFVPEVEPPSPQPQQRRARASGKDLFVELRLAGDEARRGGLFPVHIPVVRTCPTCTPTCTPTSNEGAADERLTCVQCHGTGRVTEDRMIDVAAPPGVVHGDSARIPMEDVGIEQTDLVVKVVVTVD